MWSFRWGYSQECLIRRSKEELLSYWREWDFKIEWITFLQNYQGFVEFTHWNARSVMHRAASLQMGLREQHSICIQGIPCAHIGEEIVKKWKQAVRTSLCNETTLGRTLNCDGVCKLQCNVFELVCCSWPWHVGNWILFCFFPPYLCLFFVFLTRKKIRNKIIHFYQWLFNSRICENTIQNIHKTDDHTPSPWIHSSRPAR